MLTWGPDCQISIFNIRCMGFPPNVQGLYQKLRVPVLLFPWPCYNRISISVTAAKLTVITVKDLLFPYSYLFSLKKIVPLVTLIIQQHYYNQILDNLAIVPESQISEMQFAIFSSFFKRHMSWNFFWASPINSISK